MNRVRTQQQQIDELRARLEQLEDQIHKNLAINPPETTMTPQQKKAKAAAWEAYHQQNKDNPEFMRLDDLRDFCDQKGIEGAWLKRRTELIEDLKKAGAIASDY